MMGSFSWLCCLLLFFLIVPSPSNSLSPPPPPPLCHPHDSSALLRFRNSFSNLNYSYSFCGSAANPNNTNSWDVKRDCCTWSGVTCDEVAGRVIRLDLKCSGLQGILDSNNTLFSLGHLQSLDLSEGPIPRGPQFNTFKDDSYGGNLGLCGFPISKSCNDDTVPQPSSPTSRKESDDEDRVNGIDWKVVMMGYGSGLVIGISIGYIVLTDKAIDGLVEKVGRKQWRSLVKGSKRKTRQNGGIRRRR
ncbi:LRR domain containing protein [Parasponia andersonii]|uniref:LRR domain containing protein n=1 Tax=Parasponia andersonii TaxID=3476 RepID=A0A2P5B397_PARAD|nr:LRR domain containing protein [Parasponia andersonii]